MNQESNFPLSAGFRLTTIAAAVLAGLSWVAPTHAAEINTGLPGVVLRIDNTVRYNLGIRTQGQDSALLGNPNFDDGNRNFEDGSLVANRLDLLTEMDLVVNEKYGFRVSGTAWYDAAYGDLDNTNNATANSLVDGVPTAGALSVYSKRYAKGLSGELLDAFLFANVEMNGKPVSARLGKHTVYWGESLLGGGAVHGISYGQYSLDLWKALATPGLEAKELYRPRHSMTLQMQPTSTLTLSGQVFFDWESARYPESGTYLTVNDALLKGGDTLIVAPGKRMLQGEVSEGDHDGDFGLSARWSPEWLNGTLGVYARNSSDIQPQLVVIPAVATVPAATCRALGFAPLAATTCYINPAAASVPQIVGGTIGQYRAFYGRNIEIYGLSLAKSVAGISVGAELSMRKNMPLQSVPVTALPAALVNRSLGQVSTSELTDGAPGARGDTLHGLVNLFGLLPNSAFADSGSWAVEFVWNHWSKVTNNPGAFKGSDAYKANPLNIDAVDKNFYGLAINVTPVWYQVWPSLDLSMPVSVAGGLSGNSAVTSGGNEGAGSFSIGVAADYKSRYNVALRYVGFFGDYTTTATGAMGVPQGTNAVLSDRGHLVLTFKTNF